MKIKSIEELKQIREQHEGKVNLREHGESKEKDIEILIGMSTCGISSGSRETLNEFVNEIGKEKLDNVKVIPVGCIGYCHSEPTVQINIPGNKPVLYGKITQNKVHDILEKHIKNNQPIEEWLLHMDFERA
ncbi:MAG: (2Fe-2S) ferredoxin domain-containing protein [Clostridia bacterium]|nr:(2Fe-2S) ferredoxin domain-containing protein [Clostridia bacterium]